MVLAPIISRTPWLEAVDAAREVNRCVYAFYSFTISADDKFFLPPFSSSSSYPHSYIHPIRSIHPIYLLISCPYLPFPLSSKQNLRKGCLRQYQRARNPMRQGCRGKNPVSRHELGANKNLGTTSRASSVTPSLKPTAKHSMSIRWSYAATRTTLRVSMETNGWYAATVLMARK